MLTSLPLDWIGLIAVSMGVAALVHFRRPEAVAVGTKRSNSPRTAAAQPSIRVSFPEKQSQASRRDASKATRHVTPTLSEAAKRKLRDILNARIANVVRPVSVSPRVQVAILPARLDISAQFDRLDIRIRSWIEKAQQTAKLQNEARTKLDSGDYAVLKLRDELQGVLNLAVPQNAQMPSAEVVQPRVSSSEIRFSPARRKRTVRGRFRSVAGHRRLGRRGRAAA